MWLRSICSEPAPRSKTVHLNFACCFSDVKAYLGGGSTSLHASCGMCLGLTLRKLRFHRVARFAAQHTRYAHLESLVAISDLM